jgi:hypothetical protein
MIHPSPGGPVTGGPGGAWRPMFRNDLIIYGIPLMLSPSKHNQAKTKGAAKP